MAEWKLADAKNRFSELVRRARSEGPQRVTRHGRDAVVVLSAEEFQRITAPGALIDFLGASPLADAFADGCLSVERDRDLGRDVEL
jgi:prevent-host-death family protein